MKVSNGQQTFEVDDARLPEAMADGFKPLVSVTNGQATYDVHPDDLEKAKADGFSPPQPGGGVLQTLKDTGRGVLQGGSLGFSDELAGGVGAATDAMKKMSVSDLVSDYVAHRDAERKANEEAKARSPYAYGAGQFGGAAATSLLPGAGAAKLVALGAGAGLGSSNADLTKGEVGDAALDTAQGAATGLAAAGVGKLLASAASAVNTGIEEVATNPTLGKIAAVNPSGRVVDAVAKNLGLSMEDIPGATGSFGQIAKRAAGHFVPGVSWAQRASDTAAVIQKGAMITADTIDKLAPKLAEYGPVLQEAAQRGGSSLATTNFLLQQTDPKFQSIVKNLNGENQ